MALIDRFRLDDEVILKQKCPFCDRLSPTRNALVGHLIVNHTESGLGDIDSTVAWAKMMADEAEFRYVPRRQVRD